jgi:hypothetical protein
MTPTAVMPSTISRASRRRVMSAMAGTGCSALGLLACLEDHGARRRILVERDLHHLRRHGASPLDDDLVRAHAVGLADLRPALAELPAVHDDDLVARGQEIRDGAFHRAGAGRGEHEDVTRRPEELAEPVLHLGENRGELRRAMVDHGQRHRGQHFRRDGRRPGSEQERLDHAGACSLTRQGPRRSARWSFRTPPWSIPRERQSCDDRIPIFV